ncbi:unnamed protein product [Euphydryas editha]|uniref:Fork-head domain-containing protein n=1 Tax=Euphydryas editha TaxID=104508 RepID=A0AAU9V2I3_EUPED|nr:unnamed protein product [Euphydryas editha]
MSLQRGSSYQSPWSSQTGLSELDGPMGELEPLGELAEVGFEPQTRARSNTWPLPRPENYIEPEDAGSKKNSNQNLSGAPPLPTSVTTKKNSSRRNAWGNLSYADLITQAITSSQDNRLTLSQIYEWMVQNVPYFKDKGDSNSSAGWKELTNMIFFKLATFGYVSVALINVYAYNTHYGAVDLLLDSNNYTL